MNFNEYITIGTLGAALMANAGVLTVILIVMIMRMKNHQKSQ